MSGVKLTIKLKPNTERNGITMKKFLQTSFFICVFAMFMSITSFAVQTVDNNPIYVYSRACPQAVVDYVDENISSAILCMTEDQIPDGNVYVGKPFTYSNALSDMFLFPVYIDNNIEYVYRVSQYQGNIGGTLSTFLAQQLQEISHLTSVNTPANFTISNDKLIVVIGNTNIEICELPEMFSEYPTNTNSVNNSDLLSDTITTNIVEPLISEVVFPIQTRAASSSYISLNITETQGQNSWCNAYATAIIARYRGHTNCTAKTVMSYFFGSNPSTQSSLSDGRAVEYAHAIGLINVTNSDSYLSQTSLKNYISDKSPVTLIMYRPATDAYHAVVLRGYNSSNWSIWNPWYNSYETFTIGGSYTARNGSVYMYNGVSNRGRTIYNW